MEDDNEGLNRDILSRPERLADDIRGVGDVLTGSASRDGDSAFGRDLASEDRAHDMAEEDVDSAPGSR